MSGGANLSAKIGVFGIGLAAYWPQFEGLKERLEGYQREVEKRIKVVGADVVSAGLVDTAPAAQSAGDLFARENVDLIMCYVGTYATSSQVLPAVQRRKVPVLILNLQPVPALDYPNTDTGEWLANCSACCVPEISNTFARSRVPLPSWVTRSLTLPAASSDWSFCWSIWICRRTSSTGSGPGWARPSDASRQTITRGPNTDAHFITASPWIRVVPERN